jgi:hypothetical protein
MMNLLLACLITLSAFAEESPPNAVPTVAADIDSESETFNHRKSHWTTQFAFENLRYELPFNYDGGQRKFGVKDQDMWGMRMGFGREVYLGGGFLLGARLDGYYLGLLAQDDKVVKKADVTVTSEKRTGQVYGADAILHLGWMFDYKTRNPFLGDMAFMSMELFVEGGVGRGNSYFRKDYFYEVPTEPRDDYDIIIEDSYTTQRATVGANFLSTTSGFYFTLQATTLTLDVDKRKIRGKQQIDSGGIQAIGPGNGTADLDPITVFTFGGGYKF